MNFFICFCVFFAFCNLLHIFACYCALSAYFCMFFSCFLCKLCVLIFQALDFVCAFLLTFCNSDPLSQGPSGEIVVLVTHIKMAVKNYILFWYKTTSNVPITL